MPSEIAIGLSDAASPAEAFAEAAREARAQIAGEVDLVVVLVAGSHLVGTDEGLPLVVRETGCEAVIGCGASGLVITGAEQEGGDAVLVWAASFPGGEVELVRLGGEPGTPPDEIEGLGDALADAGATIVLADPHTFAADSLVHRCNGERPGMPLIGGLASASVPGLPCLFFGDRGVEGGGAVAAVLRGIDVLPCVAQGAEPIGPEVAITAARDNIIEQLAFEPALEKMTEIVGGLDADTRATAAAGGMLIGVTIDENLPEHHRGDYLIRPIIGADRNSGAFAIGERVRVGQTVCLHSRDAESASADLRDKLSLQAEALGDAGAAGALMFTCNGRGRSMFGANGHDAGMVAEILDTPLGGFFCSGELGPVSGRNFLHGFTATMAIFPAD